MKSISLFEQKGEVLLQDEINRYIKAMSPKVDKRVQAVLYILDKHPNINTKEDILAIRDGKFNILKKLDMLPDDLRDLQRLLKKLDRDIMLLPQFLTAQQRQALELNKLDVTDITLDLESERGRQAVAKQFTPLVIRMANQFVGKCGLDKSELISSGMLGLTLAMNQYKNPEEIRKAGGESSMTFASYAEYCIRNQILQDITELDGVVKQSYYAKKKEGVAQINSIDHSETDDEEVISIDRMIELSEEPDYEPTRNEEKEWQKVFKKLESKFSSRDCDVFYRVFGLNGRKMEKTTEVARSLNTYISNIVRITQNMLAFLKKDSETREFLEGILSIYTESLVSGLYNQPREVIVESLIKDNMYVLLEEINQWSNATQFKNAVNHATDILNIEDAKFIYECIDKGFDFVDAHLRKMKPVIIAFLSNLYPTTSFKRKSDIDILDYMQDLSNTSKNYKIKW